MVNGTSFKEIFLAAPALLDSFPFLLGAATRRKGNHHYKGHHGFGHVVDTKSAEQKTRIHQQLSTHQQLWIHDDMANTKMVGRFLGLKDGLGKRDSLRASPSLIPVSFKFLRVHPQGQEE